MKSILIFFFIPLVKEVKSKEYNGYFFQDNLLQGSVMYSESHFCKICLERFGPENGHATLNTGTAIPSHVTKHTLHILCFIFVLCSGLSVLQNLYRLYKVRRTGGGRGNTQTRRTEPLTESFV